MSSAIELAAILLLAPALFGVIHRTKAFFAGRAGAPLTQPYFDLVRLARKTPVVSKTTSWVFLAGPAAALAAVVLGCALLPAASGPGRFSFEGDAILFVYALGLARFLTASAALDTGSAFEGIGASRDVTFAALTEPAIFLGLLALARLSGSLSLGGMLREPLVASWPAGAPVVAFVFGSWMLVLLAENARMPFDDPSTHLELTMVHEVMLLDHSGPALGVALYAAMLKFALFALFAVRLFIPVADGRPLVEFIVLAAGLLVIAIGVGVVESTLARLRMTRIPLLLVSACLLSGFAFLMASGS